MSDSRIEEWEKWICVMNQAVNMEMFKTLEILEYNGNHMKYTVWYVKWCFMSLWPLPKCPEKLEPDKRELVASIVVQLWRLVDPLQGCNGNETQRSNSWKASKGFERLLSFAGKRKELFKMEWVSDQLQYCLLQSFSNSHASQVFTISMKACYFHEPLPIYIIIGFVFTWGPGFWPVSSSRALSGLKPLPLDSLWTGM